MSLSAKRKALLIVLIILTCIYLPVKAGNETIPSGSYIVNMGVLPVTYGNALKPYGMIYDLTRNFEVPVKWVINPSKAKNGVDFSYNSTNYSGGPFVIPGNFITPAVAAAISSWAAQGVIGTYTTSPIVVPVYETITLFPLTVVDNQNSAIVVPYYNNAGIPGTAYMIGTPADLTVCYDFYALPHADPTWPIHSNLYDFVVTQKGSIWAACHAASVLEGSNNPNPPFQQLNYLTTGGLQCYGNNGCGPITQVHAKFPNTPYTYGVSFDADPVMQFIGFLHGATENGSERWYIPVSTGQWLSTTKRTVITSDGTNPKEGAKVAYGPAYGNVNNGLVMYEAGHSHENGSLDHSVAAQRAFFNFALLVGTKAKMKMNTSFPTVLQPGSANPMNVTVSGGVPPYTYSWSSVCSGSFDNTTEPSTAFNLPFEQRPSTCEFTIKVTDACGRRNFETVIIPVNTVLPVELLSFHGEVSNGTVNLDWETGSEINNAGFAIEKLDSYNNEFKEIGFVNGGGYSNTLIKYTFNDSNFEGLSGNYYYRLIQHDFDGVKKNLGTIVINYKSEGLSASVNSPVLDMHTKINIESKRNTGLAMRLISSSGSLVYERKVKLNEGQNKVTIGAVVSEIPAGFYFLQLLNQEQSFTFHLVKVMK